MSAPCLVFGLILAAVFNSNEWTHRGSIPAQLDGESQDLEVLYQPLLFAFAVPETTTTEHGLLVATESDLYQRNPFMLPIGPYPFASVVEDTVAPEVGFFGFRFLYAALDPTTEDVRYELMAMPDSGSPAISYRGSTILLEPGEHLLRRVVPEPNALLLAIAGGALLLWMRRETGHRTWPRKQVEK